MSTTLGGCVGSSFTGCDVIVLVLAVLTCTVGAILGAPPIAGVAAFLFFGWVCYRMYHQRRPVAMVVTQAQPVQQQQQQQQQQVSITMAAPPTTQLPPHDLMAQERVLMTQQQLLTQQLMAEREREQRDAERQRQKQLEADAEREKEREKQKRIEAASLPTSTHFSGHAGGGDGTSAFSEGGDMDQELQKHFRAFEISRAAMHKMREFGIASVSDFLYVEESDFDTTEISVIDKRKLTRLRSKLCPTNNPRAPPVSSSAHLSAEAPAKCEPEAALATSSLAVQHNV